MVWRISLHPVWNMTIFHLFLSRKKSLQLTIAFLWHSHSTIKYDNKTYQHSCLCMVTRLENVAKLCHIGHFSLELPCSHFGFPWLYHYIFRAVTFTNIIGWNMDLAKNFSSLISSFSSHLWLLLKSDNAAWTCLVVYRVAHKKRNGILPKICGCNNWYKCMR